MTEVFVGVGSNVDREANVVAGVRALRDTFGDLRLSTVWDNPAVGFDGDPFLNLVAAFDTELPVRGVARALDGIEDRFGRARGGDRERLSRTLDLDLLLFGEAVIDEPGLRLPRAEILAYAFVLAPLAELAPALAHPTAGRSYRELWDAFEGDKAVLEKAVLDLG